MRVDVPHPTALRRGTGARHRGKGAGEGDGFERVLIAHRLMSQSSGVALVVPLQQIRAKQRSWRGEREARELTGGWGKVVAQEPAGGNGRTS